jgi:hypothetical protein
MYLPGTKEAQGAGCRAQGAGLREQGTGLRAQEKDGQQTVT